MSHQETSVSHGHVGDAPADHAHDHPTERTYIKIALILTAITMFEVIIYYIEAVRDAGLLVPLLVIFSAVKFVIVVGYFMHLKFDDRRLTYIFASALLVATSIVAALYVLLTSHYIEYATDFLTSS